MDKTKNLELLKKKSNTVTNQDVDYLFSANKSKTKGFFSLIYGKLDLLMFLKLLRLKISKLMQSFLQTKNLRV